MKISKITFLLSFIVLVLFALTGKANAATLSQTSLSLSQGQSTSVYASYVSTSLYVSSNSNSNVATVSINGNTVNIYGNAAGNTTITICETNINNCSSLFVTVTGYNFGNTNLGVNVSTLTLPVGSSATISSPNSIGLYVSSNTSPNIASASNASVVAGCTAYSQYSVITGQPCYVSYNNNTSSLTISALAVGSNTLTVCQNNNYNYYGGNVGSNCSTLYVVVTSNYNNYNYTNYPVAVVPSVLGAQTCYFARTLRLGMSGTDVSCLQSLLVNLGYLDQVTSYFDQSTRNAVMYFQQDNYLIPDGVVGRITRERLF